jgi:pimeloyl-ACP methyl ester carboxylesterase
VRRYSEVSLPPRLAYALLEPGRVMAELGQLALLHPLLKRLDRGDGHTVMVLPGFLGADGSTAALRHYIASWGYDVQGWGLGRNLGPDDDGVLETRLADRLHSLFQRQNGPVSLVGWSLGGLLSRELARQFPDRVRQVITLGSPIGGDVKATSVWRLYERTTGSRVDSDSTQARLLEVQRPVPGVPCTAIYSRSDGIVAWRIARERPGPQAENIRVMASHIGLGFSATVLGIIADRLRQPVGEWQPFSQPRNRWWQALARIAAPVETATEARRAQS